jgi:hypothetical protein
MMTKNEHDKRYGESSGGVAATPEEYKNEKLRRALNDVNIHPGPMIFKDAGLEVDGKSYNINDVIPWQVWRRDDSSKVEILTPIMTIREYVEAHTIYEHKVNQVEVGDLLWPATRGRTSWINVIIFTALAAFSLYAISL